MSMQSLSKHEALAAVPVFAGLTPAQLADIARVSDARHVLPGDTLCLQGDPGTDTYVIAEGQVAVVVDGVEVAQRGPGTVVGDWALFGSGSRTATLRALSAVEAVVVDAREIDSVLMAVPACARLLGPAAFEGVR